MVPVVWAPLRRAVLVLSEPSDANSHAGVNFRFTAFSEVRHALATPSNGKYTTFAGCARSYKSATVPPNNSGQRLRSTTRRRWAPVGRGKPQWCNRLDRA